MWSDWYNQLSVAESMVQEKIKQAEQYRLIRSINQRPARRPFRPYARLMRWAARRILDFSIQLLARYPETVETEPAS